MPGDANGLVVVGVPSELKVMSDGLTVWARAKRRRNRRDAEISVRARLLVPRTSAKSHGD